MGRLIYTAIGSLDGYIADAEGDFSWAEPDAEVHSFVNDLERSIGLHLYGRRLYEVMTYWQTATEETEGITEPELDYATVWRAADKIVYSATLDAVTTPKTRLEREFDPEVVRSLVDASETDVGLGGATLATTAMRAGLVDEFQVFTYPVLVGGGAAMFPTDVRIDLRLLESRAFASGVVYSRYAAR
jgi:dihydrofolate reductase